MSKKQQTRLDFVLAAIDKFSAPMKRFNERISKITRGIRDVRKASAGLKRESGWNLLAKRAGTVRDRIAAVGRETLSLATKGTAAIAAMAGGVLAAVNSTATAGDNIAKTSQRLGIATTALQEFRYAGERSGIEVATLDMAVQRFGRRAGEAFMGKGEALPALKTLGIQLKDTHGQLKPTEDLLMDVADALSRVKDPAIRNALAMKLFDSEGVKMVQMMKDGKSGLQALREEAHRYGNILSGPTLSASEEYKDSIQNLMAAFSGVKNIIGSEFLPVIIKLAREFTEFLVANQDNIRAWVQNFAEKLPDALVKVRVALAQTWAKLQPFFEFIGSLSERFGAANLIITALALVIGGPLLMAIAALIPAVLSLGTALLATPIGWFIGAVAVFAGLAALIVSNWEPIADFFSGIWERVTHDFNEVVDMIKSGAAKITSWLPDWITGGDSEVRVKADSPSDRDDAADGEEPQVRPRLGAAAVTRDIREQRTVNETTQRQETTVKVQFEDMPRGTRVTQQGDADVDMNMGYAMVTP